MTSHDKLGDKWVSTEIQSSTVSLYPHDSSFLEMIEKFLDRHITLNQTNLQRSSLYFPTRFTGLRSL